MTNSDVKTQLENTFMEAFNEMQNPEVVGNESTNNNFDNIKNREEINNIIDGIYDGKKYIGNKIIYNKIPQIYKNIGVENVALLISPNKIRMSVLNEIEAKNLGYTVGKNDNYHGLGKETFNKALDDLADPVMIIKENANKIIVLTEQFKKGREIIVPIEINTISEYAEIKDLYNVAKTVYDKKELLFFLIIC